MGTLLNLRRYIWSGRIPIFEHIKKHADLSMPVLKESGELLPDEKEHEERGDSKFKFIAGAFDGAFGRFGVQEDEVKAEKAFQALIQLCRSRSNRKREKLYKILIKEETVLDYIDIILPKIRRLAISPQSIADEAIWMATKSPDRNVVKFGIALLGLFDADYIREILLMLALHEEFTMYCVVAFVNSQEDPVSDLVKVAKAVDGWGRIEAVQRLSKYHITDPEIKRWLLVEGYKNSVMYEYLAYVSATVGEMKKNLLSEPVDEEVLEAAGEIIDALISGGPAKDINDYEDGLDVVERYVEIVATRCDELEELDIFFQIKRLLNEADDEWDDDSMPMLSQKEKEKFIQELKEERGRLQEKRAGNGWTQERIKKIINLCDSVINKKTWEDKVLRDIQSQDDKQYQIAYHLSGQLGLDVWAHTFSRLKKEPFNQTYWFQACSTKNLDRLSQVIQLAIEVLPLEKIASGPANALGLGEEFNAHQCLDFVLQRLSWIRESQNMPEDSIILLKAGLSSPVVRNRNLALMTLSKRYPDEFPSELENLLRKAYNDETNEETKTDIYRMLDGKPFEQQESE